MRHLLKTLLFISILLTLATCRKEEPENPPFDHQKAIATRVGINTSEIGGNGLVLMTTFDDESIITNGGFSTVVSKTGEQLLFLKDANDEIRALTLSTPKTSSSEIMKLDAVSTAVSLIFSSPGILTTDGPAASSAISKIQNLTSFTPFKTYLKNNLKVSSLNRMITDTVYTNLLSACIEEYYRENIGTNDSKGDNDSFEQKNNFSIDVKSPAVLELKNYAYRYVTVLERDLNSSNTEIGTKTVLASMSGAEPISWGSLFTLTLLQPTTRNLEFNPSSNVSFSELWVAGPGWKPTSETPPQTVKALKIPVAETIVGYVVFPLLDLICGGMDIFDEVPDISRLSAVLSGSQTANSISGLATMTNRRDFTRVTIDIVMSMLGPVAAAYAIPGVGPVLAAASITVGSANLVAFAIYMFDSERYSRFNINNSVSGPPSVPRLNIPANNVSGISLPVSLSWYESMNTSSYTLEVSEFMDFSVRAIEQTGISGVSKSITDLSHGTRYFWRIKSVNANSASNWSETRSFVTEASIPSVTTAPINSITSASAVAGGEVVSDGGSTVTDRGVYFGVSPNPETNGTKVQMGNGTGTFNETVYGLSPSRTYYLNAYAINDKGEALGTQITFTTPAASATSGRISGIVRDASSSAPISGVTIKSYLSANLISTSVSESDGRYEVTLQPNSGYTVIFGKTGYFDAEYQNVIVTSNTNTILEPVLQINESFAGNGSMSGTIKDALNGAGIPNVALTLRKGMNVTSGVSAGTTVTSATGSYSFSGIPAGNYTIECISTGYNRSNFNVICLGGQEQSGQDATMSPVLQEGNTRIVLTWGPTPSDLDSHFTGPLSDGSRFHMYYPYAGSSQWSDVVSLDLDDVSSYGPETTTLIQEIEGIYRFSIHDYSNKSATSSTALSNSGAQVKVYRNTGLVATFNVPPSTDGTLWTVFEMNNGTITTINQMSYVSSSGSVTKSGYVNPENDLFINLPAK